MYLNTCDGDLRVHSDDVDCFYLHVCTVTEYINGVSTWTHVVMILRVHSYVCHIKEPFP